MEDLILLMAKACGYNYEDIMRRPGNSRVSMTRQIIWYKLFHIKVSYTEIGAYFGATHANIMYGVNRIRDLMTVRDRLVGELMEKVDQAFEC